MLYRDATAWYSARFAGNRSTSAAHSRALSSTSIWSLDRSASAGGSDEARNFATGRIRGVAVSNFLMARSRHRADSSGWPSRLNSRLSASEIRGFSQFFSNDGSAATSFPFCIARSVWTCSELFAKAGIPRQSRSHSSNLPDW